MTMGYETALHCNTAKLEVEALFRVYACMKIFREAKWQKKSS
jgi:hypothetical protein